jgi:hypothetical protein
MEAQWYASIAGIAGLTLILVQGLKKYLGDSENFFAKLPTPVWTLIIAMALTTFANKVLGKLEGDLLQLLTDGVFAAFAAAGAFEGLRPSNLSKSIADSGKNLILMFVLVPALLFTAACSSGALAPKVAHYGADVARVANQAQDVVLEADRSGLQPNKDLTAKAMAEFRKLGVTFQKLADGLRAYDALTGAAQAEQGGRIRELLQEARKLALGVMAFTGGNEKLTGSLLDLFGNLEKLYDEITLGLAPFKPATN